MSASPSRRLLQEPVLLQAQAQEQARWLLHNQDRCLKVPRKPISTPKSARPSQGSHMRLRPCLPCRRSAVAAAAVLRRLSLAEVLAALAARASSAAFLAVAVHPLAMSP